MIIIHSEGAPWSGRGLRELVEEAGSRIRQEALSVALRLTDSSANI
jgi:hypothetical protein